MQMLAIDLAKQSIHVHSVDADGRVNSRRVGRTKLLALVASLAPKVIAMEACATAHHWARGFLAAGHEVRLVNPRFVKPLVRGSKNDAGDAEAIFDAASRPTMRFVPVKSPEQQGLQSPHRVRDRLVSQRTNLINYTRGLLALPGQSRLLGLQGATIAEGSMGKSGLLQQLQIVNDIDKILISSLV